MEPKKFEYIDSLRGIAVLLVICSHISLLSSSVVWIPRGVYYFMDRGIHGVQLFFIVSAFTLMISYHNRKGEKNEVLNFFIRRFFRIAPVFYLAIIYFTFANFGGVNFFEMGWADIPLKGFISSFFFVNGCFPAWINSYVPGGWSITVEFMFYALLPIICRLVNNANKAILFLFGTLLLSSILNLILVGSSFDKYDFLYYYLPNQLPVFALGILAYWLVKDGLNKIKVVNLLLSAGIVFVYCFVFSLSFHILYSLVFVLLLITLSQKPYSFFSNRVLATVGKCSFSMYLVHFGIVGILAKNDIHNIISVNNTITAFCDILLFFLAVTLASFVISYFTYKYIEVPGQNVGRKLIRKLNGN